MKQILIVGGAGGLGSALVKELLNQEYSVVVSGKTKAVDERVREFYRIDATAVDWPALFLTVEKETAAPIDALIFVAGTGVFGNTTLIPLQRARQAFELNFWACAKAARAAAEHWEAGSRAGKFVAVLSISARRAVPFEAYYSASKAATARFLECLEVEYAHRNIEFVCAFPGLLRTSFRQQADWYGLQPILPEGGADPQETARAVINLLKGKRRARVIGWRERSIDLADRLLPGLYDRVVLRRRVRTAQR